MTGQFEHQNLFKEILRIFRLTSITTGLFLATLLMVAPIAHAQDEAPTVLITGANASHGLAFTNDYAELGWNVIATCRNPDKADRLKALAENYPNIVIEELDIVDYEEIDQLAEKYRDTPIDVLLLNAAINAFRFGPNRFGNIDYDWFEEILKVNIIGQLRVSEAFLGHVEASDQKKIIAMTSTGGSITNVRPGTPPCVAYCTSKAGLNMAMRMLSIKLKDRNIIVSIMAPGTVDSEDYMNAEDPKTVPSNYQAMIKVGVLAPRTAINDMIALIDRLTIEDTGIYYEWTGEVLPW
jgi:NAD(P)-dependent dehydrogenase (short-subunit alcohol dehydrogenase family)